MGTIKNPSVNCQEAWKIYGNKQTDLPTEESTLNKEVIGRINFLVSHKAFSYKDISHITLYDKDTVSVHYTSGFIKDIRLNESEKQDPWELVLYILNRL